MESIQTRINSEIRKAQRKAFITEVNEKYGEDSSRRYYTVHKFIRIWPGKSLGGPKVVLKRLPYITLSK
jgi:hypothetical protein